MDIRENVRNWLNAIDFDTEITLTFSNDISKKQAESALFRFWNRVDTSLYGSAAIRRYNKRCERVNVIEGDGVGYRYHFHCISKCPKDRFETVTAYCDFLREQWDKDNRNNYIVSFAPIRDKQKYSRYITKSVQRVHCDALILDSSHIATAPNL